MTNAGAFLLTLGLILYVGVVGSYLFERYRIPDVLNLIGIGLLLGPILRLIDPGILTPWMPYVGVVALSLILFEGGLDLDFAHIVSRFGASFLLATATFCVGGGLIAVSYRMATGAPWLASVLLGAILGCVSSAVILPVSAHLKAPEPVKAAVNLEAVLSDLWGVVSALVIIRVFRFESFDPGQIVNTVVGAFSTAIVGGAVFGLLWLWALKRLSTSPFAYMMTLAAVFVLYGLTELVHGSGPMAALTFGVFLTNADKIANVFGLSYRFVLDDKIRWFNTEATFFARTFFFVYLGLVISLRALDRSFFLVTAVAFLSVLLSRYAVVRLSERWVFHDGAHTDIYMAMVPRGLTSAVLASMAVGAGVPGTEAFLEYTFALILLTNFFMTWAVYRFGNGSLEAQPPLAGGTP